MKERAMLEMTETMERLEAVAEALEMAAERIAEQQASLAAEAQQSVGRIVATVETAREAELERRLAEAEERIAALTDAAALSAAAELRAAAAVAPAAGRVTLPVGVATMLAKQGVALDAGGSLPSLEGGALDAALASLSVEQRIAVKSELMRAGLLG